MYRINVYEIVDRILWVVLLSLNDDDNKVVRQQCRFGHNEEIPLERSRISITEQSQADCGWCRC